MKYKNQRNEEKEMRIRKFRTVQKKVEKEEKRKVNSEYC